MTKIVKHTEVVSIEVVSNNWRGGSDPPGVTSYPCQAAQVPGSAAKIYIKLELCKQNSKKVRKWRFIIVFVLRLMAEKMKKNSLSY